MALTDKLTAIGDAIRSKTGGSELLTLDEMPQEIQSIQTGGGGEVSEELDTLTINPTTITSYGTQSSGEIRDYAFYNCYSLTSIDIPNIVAVRTYSFQNCTSLTEVSLPNVVRMLGSTFRGCESLSRAELGSILDVSGAFSFRDTALDTLILRGNGVSQLTSTNIFQSTPIADGTGYIYVPSALLEQYKVATNWATYANQFRAIEDYPEICGTGEVS